MSEYHYAEAGDFDFTHSPVYRKTATLNASQVEMVASPQEVVTVINGKEETRYIAKPGDRIITGVKGERYVLDDAKFNRMYVVDPNDPARLISRNTIQIVELPRNTEITPPWGGTQRAHKGDFVARNTLDPSDTYLIEREAFLKTYTQVTPGAAVKGQHRQPVREKGSRTGTSAPSSDAVGNQSREPSSLARRIGVASRTLGLLPQVVGVAAEAVHGMEEYKFAQQLVREGRIPESALAGYQTVLVAAHGERALSGGMSGLIGYAEFCRWAEETWGDDWKKKVAPALIEKLDVSGGYRAEQRASFASNEHPAGAPARAHLLPKGPSFLG